jgi:hypothetical protein
MCRQEPEGTLVLSPGTPDRFVTTLYRICEKADSEFIGFVRPFLSSESESLSIKRRAAFARPRALAPRVSSNQFNPE